MWKHFVLSTAIVAAIWLGSSVVTTIYLLWLDGSYEKSLRDHQATIDAAAALREDVWRLYASGGVDSRKGPLSETAAVIELRMNEHLAKLEETANTSQEKATLSEIHDLLRPYYAKLGAASRTSKNDEKSTPSTARNLANQISDKAARISDIDHDLLGAAAERRLRIGSRIFWGRMIAILFGPLIGVMLGWSFSRGFAQTVAQIRVTLTGTTIGPEDDLGTVRFRRKDDLQFIRQQIETVVERLRRTGSELQQARSDVLRSERLAAIGGLATGIAHEIRNPLTSVKLLLQNAATHPGDALIPQKKLRLILDEVGRMEGTIQGLLDFSRPPTLQRVPHDLRDTVRRAANLVEGRASTHGVRLVVDPIEECITVDGDPQQLHQVFVNLLINGIEATPDGGTVRVGFHVVDDQSQVRVRIDDRGSGIPTDILPRLFEPFATSKERGTGLGLAISRRIVENHGGTINAFNRQEHGATFEVVLPIQVTLERQPEIGLETTSACRED
jgi:two-component system, NtrC family, sensor histidine kinase HydH